MNLAKNLYKHLSVIRLMNGKVKLKNLNCKTLIVKQLKYPFMKIKIKKKWIE